MTILCPIFIFNNASLCTDTGRRHIIPIPVTPAATAAATEPKKGEYDKQHYQSDKMKTRLGC